MSRENPSTFCLFIQAQMDEMRRHRWIESEKAGKDLGEDAFFDWIERYAETFRLQWERSREEQLEYQH